jgi:hypothetical protein
MGIPVVALPINLPAPAAPTLTASATGGSLASGTLYVKTTAVSAYGETLASAEASVPVTGPTGMVSVPSPPAQPWAKGYNVYAALTSGAEVLQNGSTPIPIGTPYNIASLAAGTVAPPPSSTADSPWPSYAFNRASAIVLNIPVPLGIEYTMAVYNCAAHILLRITPDQPGQTYFEMARQKFGLLAPRSGVISSASDQGTSDALAVPDQLKNMTVGDLNYYCTPWGREFLSFQMDFGQISGLT